MRPRLIPLAAVLALLVTTAATQPRRPRDR